MSDVKAVTHKGQRRSQERGAEKKHKREGNARRMYAYPRNKIKAYTPPDPAGSLHLHGLPCLPGLLLARALEGILIIVAIEVLLVGLVL